MSVTLEDLKQCHWGHTTFLDGAKGSWQRHRSCQEHARLKLVRGCDSRTSPIWRRMWVDGVLLVANLAEAAAALNRTPEENAAMAEERDRAQQVAMPLQGGSGEKKWKLADGISECKRELMQRERVYPRLIDRGQLEQHTANQQNRDLTGILRFLEWCLKREARLREFMTAEGEGQ